MRLRTEIVDARRLKVFRGLAVDRETGEMAEILGRGIVEGRESYFVVWIGRSEEPGSRSSKGREER